MMRKLSQLMPALAAGLVAALPLAAQEADPALVARGQYLATAGDCAACHGTPGSDVPYGGGYAVDSPMGKIYGSNISPSKTDGIGNWSLAEFEAAVRKGRAPGMHFLYPAMPYTAFAGISDADMKALYAYFMLGVQPVENKVPATALAFPFNFRPLMAGWNLLYGGGSAPAEAPAAGAARGQYLADTLAHCSTCHTPRNALMAEEGSRYLGGGKVGAWVAPNISSDPVDGIGNWSEAQLVQYLSTGAVHGLAVAAGEMGTAVQKSFSQLSPEDLQAIAGYIKSVPAVHEGGRAPRSGAVQPPLGQAAAREHPIAETDFATAADLQDMSGAQLYGGACATCHGADGAGTPDGRLPALAGSSAVGSADPSNLVMTITEGVNRTVGGTQVFMPAFATGTTGFEVKFDDAQVAKIADYVATTFGPADHHVTEADVARVRASATEQGWLIGHAAMLTWIGLVAAAIVVALLLVRLSAGRRRPQRG